MGHDHSHGHGSSCGGHDHFKIEHAEKEVDAVVAGGTNTNGHDHGHGHGHGHEEDSKSNKTKQAVNHSASSCSHDHHQDDEASREVLKRLKRAMFLCGSFLIVEVVGGYWAGSLAVLSDAAHLFADLASFAVAIAAAHLAALPTTDQHTFGLKRTESLAALLSMISLAIVSLYLAVEAIRRLIAPAEAVDGKLMSQVAFIGVCVNIALAFVLGVENHIHMPGADHGHSHDHGHGHEHNNADDDNNKKQETAKCENDHGHSHEHGHGHNHKEEKVKPVDTSNSHSHGHDHGDKETVKLLPSSSNKGNYEAIHMDELKPKAAAKTEKPQQKKPLNNINLQAAYLHVFGDLLQSLGVFIAGLAIWYNPKWTMIDPICTLLFCAVVFYSTLGVLRHSVAVLLQEVPPELNWQRIYETISSIEGVENVHDLHVWSISHGDPALAVHCSCGEYDPQIAMRQISTALNQMGIAHITIQMQQGNGECITCTANAGCDFARLSSKHSTTSASSNIV